MKYGLPYKGSKNKLAERIVRLLPKRKNLVDLFCGGCAVSHAALLMKKFEHIYINDVNWMCPTLFMDALAGKYNNETRWISREDFFRLKDTDPYVAVVWSFGNNMRDYLYSKEIEPLKKAIHYAMFFGDYSLAKELGHDLSFIGPIKDMQQRYLAVKHYFSRLGHFRQQSYEGGYDSTGIVLQNLATRSTPTCKTGGYETPLSDWRQRNEVQTSVGTSTSRMRQPNGCIQKKKSTGRNLQLRANSPNSTDVARRATSQQPCIACNIESDSTACLTSIRGGARCADYKQYA